MPPLIIFSNQMRQFVFVLMTTLEILIWGELSSFARSSTQLHTQRDVCWHGSEGGKREVAKLFHEDDSKLFQPSFPDSVPERTVAISFSWMGGGWLEHDQHAALGPNVV